MHFCIHLFTHASSKVRLWIVIHVFATYAMCVKSVCCKCIVLKRIQYDSFLFCLQLNRVSVFQEIRLKGMDKRLFYFMLFLSKV